MNNYENATLIRISVYSGNLSKISRNSNINRWIFLKIGYDLEDGQIITSNDYYAKPKSVRL